jgi:hypothetical protein
MKPGDFVSTPYYHYTSYGYIEKEMDYGRYKVLTAYREDRQTKVKDWSFAGLKFNIDKNDCTLVQSTPYKEDVQELIDIALDNRDEDWFKELHKRGVEA